MSQDKRIQHGIQFREFPTRQAIDVGTDAVEKVKKSVTLHVKDNIHTVYAEVVEAPFYMVSERVQEVIQMFEPDLKCSSAIFATEKQEGPFVYKVLFLDRMECLHENTEFYKDNSVKKIILDSEKIAGQHIFKIKGISPIQVVVSMPIVEALLRRNCVGIQFQEIEII